MFLAVLVVGTIWLASWMRSEREKAKDVKLKKIVTETVTEVVNDSLRK